MNEEIKKVLDYLKNDNYFTESPEYEVSNYDLYKMLNSIQTDKLLNYITNLQQENERLKELIESGDETYDIQETIINRQKMKILELESQLEGTTHCYDEEEHEILKRKIKKTVNYLKHIKRTFEENDAMYELLDSAIFLLERGDSE